ncbi:TSCPD domain-containing protein, partial [Rhodovarius lipocyclicus]
AQRAPQRVGQVLAPVTDAARRAMADAVLPFLHAAPPAPVALPAPARAHVERPAERGLMAHPRSAGGNFYAIVGGHRVAMRTAEDSEGKLREIAFTLAKEGAAYRSLMDAFAQSVSIGLSAGLPLEQFIDAFSYTRFGPSGVVEGDADITRATSVLDWAFRRLAIEYLGRKDLPQPSDEDCAPDSISSAPQQAPLLPLDLPTQTAPDDSSAKARRRAFRVVA